VGGLALIEVEVEADRLDISKDGGYYYFTIENRGYYDKIIAYYPIVNTIISSIEDNPNYLSIWDRDEV